MKRLIISKKYNISALILKVFNFIEDTSDLNDIVTHWEGYIVFNNILMA